MTEALPGRPPRSRVTRRPVHGVLLLDKPLGVSSNAALQQAKRLYRAEKAGHTGTLDPLATGLLPLCFGAATKFAQASLDADKRYLATLQLGVTTTTADLEGEVVERRAVDVSRDAIEAICASFVGRRSQMPPMHSALKHEGKPMYAYARAGVAVERRSREITIHRIDVIEGTRDCWTIEVSCSKGTYIRTLVADIGEALGCGAHLAALRRSRSGRLSVDQALSFDRLHGSDEPALDAFLLPIETLVMDWPHVTLAADDAGRFLTGSRRRLGLKDAPCLRVLGPGGVFLGTGHAAGGELIATRLLSPAEIAAASAMHSPQTQESKTAESLAA